MSRLRRWGRIHVVRVRRFLLAVLVAAFVVAPAARLVAAAPCPGPAQMDCCAGMDDKAAPPCNCSLNPIPPAPVAADAAHAPAIVLAEAPLPAVAAEAPATAGPAADVTSRARPAPLHLLHSVFLI
jgi:hypothetical protein